MGVFGLLFVVSSPLSLVRVRRSQPRELRDALFLVGLAIAFGFQLFYALQVIVHPHDTGSADGIAVLVIVCFLVGIGRSWELVADRQSACLAN